MFIKHLVNNSGVRFQQLMRSIDLLIVLSFTLLIHQCRLCKLAQSKKIFMNGLHGFIIVRLLSILSISSSILLLPD